jgi:HSP20 family molecular chaperone IbpA
MDPTTIELMEEHVRDIYRAITGGDLPFSTEPGSEVSIDELASRFIDLESAARRIPTVAERVPPFSFSPPIDVIANDREVLIELAVPGAQRGDVSVVCHGEIVSISGVRGRERERERERAGHYLHAEVPRGPFYRMVHVPVPVGPNITVEVEDGLVRVCLPRLDSSDTSSDTSTESQPPTTHSEDEPTTNVGMEHDNGDTKSE